MDRIRSRIRLTWTLPCAIVAIAVVAGVAVHAQIWRGGFGFNAPPRHPTAATFAGAFNHCRLMFRSDRREKRGWSTDYPGADINFSVRLGELHNSDIPDAWEREAEDSQYFYKFSPDAYSVGIDVVLYAMTH